MPRKIFDKTKPWIRSQEIRESYKIQIKLSSGNELIICASSKLQYQIPREKFEPDPGFEPELATESE